MNKKKIKFIKAPKPNYLKPTRALLFRFTIQLETWNTWEQGKLENKAKKNTCRVHDLYSLQSSHNHNKPKLTKTFINFSKLRLAPDGK